MLSPMQVQYLVALCCRKREPEAIDIIVGDMVEDPAAEKERDVDVTVTTREPDGSLTAFMAYEVKREGEPLDVVAVEQLCAKLGDMTSITHRSIVSSSGYTGPAIKKAKAHDIGLYTWRPWTKPLSEQFPNFPDTGTPAEFLAGFQTNLLYWDHYRLNLICREGPTSFIWAGATPIVGKSGRPHEQFKTMAEYQEGLLRRSTETLCLLEPAQTILRTYPILATVGNDAFESSPGWPHTHTIDISADQVFLILDSGAVHAVSVTISGFLQWRRRKRTPEFYIMEEVPSGEIFAAAAVAEYGTDDGRMLVIVFPPDSRALDFHIVQLLEKHRN